MYASSTLGLIVASWSMTLATAKTIAIKAENLYFEPSNITAAVGDILEFHFGPNNHSVVMGDQAKPCQPAATGGFYSGFLPASSGENAQVFQVTVNDTRPIVYYCSQNASAHNHCKSGMIGFVNQLNTEDMTTYASAANASSLNLSPDVGPFGGSLIANAAANSTANTTSAATSTPTSTASAGSSGSSTSGASHDTNSGAAVAGKVVLAIGTLTLLALMAI